MSDHSHKGLTAFTVVLVLAIGLFFAISACPQDTVKNGGTATTTAAATKATTTVAATTTGEKPNFAQLAPGEYPPLNLKTFKKAGLKAPINGTDGKGANARATFVSWTLEATPEDEYYIGWRWDLSRNLLSTGAIETENVLQAFLRTPREFYCRAKNMTRAYEDIFMDIGWPGSSITDPTIVTVMTQTINPQPGMKVLEIGTATGYQAAILSQMTDQVYSIEIIPGLLEETDAIYRKLEPYYPTLKNIRRKVGDGYYGWKENAPFDRIIVTCGIDHIPPILIQQLKPEGIMVIPVGQVGDMTLLKIVKHVSPKGEISVERTELAKVRFVLFVAAPNAYAFHTKEEVIPENK